MTDELRRKASEVAIERLDDLRRLVDDPDAAVAEQARVDYAVVARGLEAIADAAEGKRQRLLQARWAALIAAHRATGKARPKLIEVAEQMGWTSEQPLRDYCRELGISDWHDVHPIVAAAPR